MPPALSRNAVKWRRRRLRRAGVLGLAAGVLAWWTWGWPYVSQMPVFRVQEIDLGSCPVELRAPIATLLRPYMGQSYFTLRRYRAQLEVDLTRLPAVRVARVELQWPRWVKVHVLPREPLMQVVFADRLWLVDEEGVIVREVAERVPGLPLVYGLTVEEDFPGGTIPADQWQPLCECLAAARSKGVELACLAWKGERGLQVRTSEGERWILGLPENLIYKLQLCAAIRESLRREGTALEYVDVSAEIPICKPLVASQRS